MEGGLVVLRMPLSADLHDVIQYYFTRSYIDPAESRYSTMIYIPLSRGDNDSDSDLLHKIVQRSKVTTLLGESENLLDKPLATQRQEISHSSFSLDQVVNTCGLAIEKFRNPVLLLDRRNRKFNFSSHFKVDSGSRRTTRQGRNLI